MNEEQKVEIEQCAYCMAIIRANGVPVENVYDLHHGGRRMNENEL